MRPLRPALLNRYAIDQPIDLGDAIQRFVGSDITTGQTVVLAFLAPEMLELLARARAATHRHLAGILAVVDSPPPAAFAGLVEMAPTGPGVVAELVRGRSLAQLVRGEPVPMDRAVAWSIRILEALQVLHDQHSVHGAVNAHAIVAEPRGRAIPPVLSFLIAPPLVAYASRERLAGAGPSVADDLWAVSLLLLRMLSGQLTNARLNESSVRNELIHLGDSLLGTVAYGRELQSILQCALAPEPASRPGSAALLLELLECWERRVPFGQLPFHAKPKPQSHSSHRGQPPAWDCLQSEFQDASARLQAALEAVENLRSVPPGHLERVLPPPSQTGTEARARAGAGQLRARPEPVRRRMPSITLELANFRKQSKPRLGKWLFLLSLLGAVAVAGAYLITHYSSRLTTSPVGSVAQSFFPIGSADGERPKISAKQEQAACIRSYFRPNTLVERADLGFVCNEEDLLTVNRRLYDELILEPSSSVPYGSAGGAPSPTTAEPAVAKDVAGQGTAEAVPYMIIRSAGAGKGWQLGWYELVASGIIRQNCCREAEPIRLPETSGWCQQLQTVVRRISTESVKVGDISPGVRAFDDAIACLLAQGRHVAYPYKVAPTSAQKSAFQQFLKHAAEVDARRTGKH